MCDFFNESLECFKIQSGSEIFNLFHFLRRIGKRNIIQYDTAMLIPAIEIETTMGYCIA